jgi:hypothetical protein
MIEKAVNDIFKAILAQNSLDNRNAIPHSDDFFSRMRSIHGFSDDFIRETLLLLREAHKIFIMEIVKKDERNNVDRIEGYIDADLSTVRRLRGVFHKLLADLYEEDTGRRLPPHKVIKEMFTKMGLYNNTPVGHIANKAIMLEEYELLLEKEYNAYTESWKEPKLSRLLEERNDLLRTQLTEKSSLEAEAAAAESAPEAKRAVDSASQKEISALTSLQSIDKVLQIYGIEFFLRINLRRYNFDFVKTIVEQRIIKRKEDLIMLKRMLQKLRENADRDPDLARHLDELGELERLVNRHLLLRMN